MKYARTSVLLVGALLLAACQEDRAQLFVGTQWKVGQVGEERSFADGVATLSLSREGRLSAFAGCNMMGGTYRYEASRLEVGPLMATRMACGEKKMRDEQLLGDALAKGPFTVRESHAGAELKAGDGTVIVLVPVE